MDADHCHRDSSNSDGDKLPTVIEFHREEVLPKTTTRDVDNSEDDGFVGDLIVDNATLQHNDTIKQLPPPQLKNDYDDKSSSSSSHDHSVQSDDNTSSSHHHHRQNRTKRRGVRFIVLAGVLLLMSILVVPTIYLQRQSSSRDDNITTSANNVTDNNKIISAASSSLDYLQKQTYLTTIPEQSFMQPTTNTTTTVEQQLRSTEIPDNFILQSCICNHNGTCLGYNIIMKDEIFYICIHHDNINNNGGGTSDSSISTSKTGGGGDATTNQLSSLYLYYHLDHIRSMNITHIETVSVFDAVTSSISLVDNTTSTYMSPWVTVVEGDSNNLPDSKNLDDNTPKMILRMQQLLNFWFNYQNSNVDIRGQVEVSLLDDEGSLVDEGGGTPKLSSFYLTAQLVNDKCRFSSGPDDTVPVSINGGDTIVFACTCDLSNSCYDLNLGLATITTGTPPPSSIIRICVIPQQGDNGVVSVDKIVRITYT